MKPDRIGPTGRVETWAIVVDVARASGKRQQIRRRGFLTKKAAQEELARIVSDAGRGTFVKPSRTSVEAFLTDEWLPAKRSGLKASTASAYAQMIRTYVVPQLGQLELGKVDGAALNALYASLLDNGRTGASGRRGGLSPKTVRNVHGLLHRAFADAVRWRRLTVNPCESADQPRNAPPEMKVWTPVEIRTFLHHADADRLAAAWRLFFATGMRRGELLGLRWSDIDLDAQRLTIVQTRVMAGDVPVKDTPKTRSGARTLALDPATVGTLRTWRSRQNAERLLMGSGWIDRDGLLVTDADGSPVHPQVLSRRFLAIGHRAGLPRIRLHDTRHSYASAAIAAGVNVRVLSSRLGHADVTVTLKVYSHLMPWDDQRAADATAAAIFGNGDQSVTNGPRPTL